MLAALQLHSSSLGVFIDLGLFFSPPWEPPLLPPNLFEPCKSRTSGFDGKKSKAQGGFCCSCLGAPVSQSIPRALPLPRCKENSTPHSSQLQNLGLKAVLRAGPAALGCACKGNRETGALHSIAHPCCQEGLCWKWGELAVFSSQEAGKGWVFLEDGCPCSPEELAQVFWSVLEAGTGALLHLAFSKTWLQMCTAEVREAVEVGRSRGKVFRELFLTLHGLWMGLGVF